MQENKLNEEIWLCSGCLDFSFTNKDNKKLLLFENENNLTTNIDLTKFSTTCSICLRKLGKPLKGLPCNCCNSLVHRRCTNLKSSEIRHLSKTKKYIWGCHYCKKKKFPFVNLDCNELEQESFNSLYFCKCLKNMDFTTVKDKNVFHYTPINNREDEKTSLADTHNSLESFTTQTNFDYFQTHDFHKLIQKKQAQNSFSILHTNICSLYANAEDLEMLINNLEHSFRVIALSESWTSKQETNKLFPELRNYQPFYATQGTTTKSGCRFYVKMGLKEPQTISLFLFYRTEDLISWTSH